MAGRQAEDAFPALHLAVHQANLGDDVAGITHDVASRAGV